MFDDEMMKQGTIRRMKPVTQDGVGAIPIRYSRN